MPESRTRKSAEAKQKLKAQRDARSASDASDQPGRALSRRSKKVKAPASRRWVPPTFITVGLIGVAWLITYYVAGPLVPYMRDLGNWNILIGMGGMAAAFIIATLWK